MILLEMPTSLNIFSMQIASLNGFTKSLNVHSVGRILRIRFEPLTTQRRKKKREKMKMMTMNSNKMVNQWIQEMFNK